MPHQKPVHSSVVYLRPPDPERSTIADEIAALEWQLGEIARNLAEGDSSTNKTTLWRLNRILQHSYRIEQMARGLKVLK